MRIQHPQALPGNRQTLSQQKGQVGPVKAPADDQPIQHRIAPVNALFL